MIILFGWVWLVACQFNARLGLSLGWGRRLTKLLITYLWTRCRNMVWMSGQLGEFTAGWTVVPKGLWLMHRCQPTGCWHKYVSQILCSETTWEYTLLRNFLFRTTDLFTPNTKILSAVSLKAHYLMTEWSSKNGFIKVEPVALKGLWTSSQSQLLWKLLWFGPQSEGVFITKYFPQGDKRTEKVLAPPWVNYQVT